MPPLPCHNHGLSYTVLIPPIPQPSISLEVKIIHLIEQQIVNTSIKGTVHVDVMETCLLFTHPHMFMTFQTHITFFCETPEEKS